MSTREKIDEIKLEMEEMRRVYSVDQRELGKLMIVVSTTLLLFSAHAALSFRSAANSVDSLNEDLQTVSGIVESQDFQQAVDVIRTLNSQAISRQIDAFVAAFQSFGSSIEDSEQVEQQLRDRYELYQWIALVAIMGEVAGVAVIYV